MFWYVSAFFGKFGVCCGVFRDVWHVLVCFGYDADASGGFLGLQLTGKVEDGIFGTSGGIGFTKANELFVGRVAMLGFAVMNCN